MSEIHRTDSVVLSETIAKVIYHIIQMHSYENNNRCNMLIVELGKVLDIFELKFSKIV